MNPETQETPMQTTRKDRYATGDRVILHREPEHEGPHEGDFDWRPERLAVVTAVELHPHNEEWVTGYEVAERDAWPPHHTIRPGQIARLAPEIAVHYFDHGTGSAYDTTQSDDTIRDGDVLVVTDESPYGEDVLVVGVMVRAWPTAVTEMHGEFHTLAAGVEWSLVGQRPAAHEGTMWAVPADPGTDYTASVARAREVLAECEARIAAERLRGRIESVLDQLDPEVTPRESADPALGLTAAAAAELRDEIEAADLSDDGALAAHEALHLRATQGRAF